jgi:uncharacterized protein (DUF885 family)
MAPDIATVDLHELFDEYLERRFALDPYYATTKRDMRYNALFANTRSSAWVAGFIALEQRFLEAVTAVPERGLSRRDRIDRQVFLYTRRKNLEVYHYPIWLLPVSPVNSRLNNFARMGAGGYYFSFDTVSDYDNWLERVAAAGPWFEQLITNFSTGIKTGVVHPGLVAERMLPQFEAHIVENVEDSLYYRPIINMPAHFSAPDRARLELAFRRMITEELVPAYQRIATFFREEYIPAARTSIAWGDLPNGAAWYRQRIRYYTSTELSADEIHRIGLEQMTRLDREVEKLRNQAGFDGPTSAWLLAMRDDTDQYYTSAEGLLDAYRSLVERANIAAKQIFSLTPETQLEVWSVEPFRAASASRASYRRPPLDRSGPGIVYVNTSDLSMQPKYDVETLFLHEGIPGHHFQLALMLEMEDLPLVRRCETEIVFSEGWALYAQALGLEMGFYQSTVEQLGFLNSMRLRAARLVVDTGLHSLGWSRGRAVRYIMAHTTRSAASARNEVDRYIARPAQALAYMLGYLQIIDLRRSAESALGESFDLQAFHRAVLEDGALPLPVLNEKMQAWIKAQSL